MPIASSPRSTSIMTAKSIRRADPLRIGGRAGNRRSSMLTASAAPGEASRKRTETAMTRRGGARSSRPRWRQHRDHGASGRCPLRACSTCPNPSPPPTRTSIAACRCRSSGKQRAQRFLLLDTTSRLSDAAAARNLSGRVRSRTASRQARDDEPTTRVGIRSPESFVSGPSSSSLRAGSARQAVDLLGQHDLAGEPRRPRRVRREVEQIFLFLAGRRKSIEILRPRR